MAIQYVAANYADFKMFMSRHAFEGDIFYYEAFPSQDAFFVYAIDAGRRVSITMTLSGTSDQKPSSFSTDFPSAVQLTGASSIGFVAD